ncbi:YwiC-like family protein [Micromonospora sp. CPCC 206060]|uniref:YwiC-like family protein n=1 Tax=Micromonospora sp. CPCC 206060 TaxID=3122406 RepID=UPI002FEF3D79
MTASVRAAARPRATRGRLRRYLPPQHGAWAMLLLPYLAALAVTGVRWPHLPLLGAWLAGYLFSYYALQAVKVRRPARVRPQLLLYGPVTVACAVPVLAAEPELFAFAPAYAVLLAGNAWYAWRRRERALVNDLLSVLQSCLLVFVVAMIAEVPSGAVTEVFLAVLAYLTGTVLYVKTMIRERASLAYRRTSVAYHLLALVVAVLWLGPALSGVFVAMLVRAAVFPGRRLTPKQVGLVEIGLSVLLLVVIGLTA